MRRQQAGWKAAGDKCSLRPAKIFPSQSKDALETKEMVKL